MTGEPRCSDASAAAGEQLAGSAPQAVAWVALEQNGPWGAKAFTASHLDPELGSAVESVAASHQVRPALIRRPGRHPDQHLPTGSAREVLVAYTHPGGSWLLEATLEQPDQLLDLDWAALEKGDLEQVRRSLPAAVVSRRPHLLVCTNGTRDVCCAVKGRPVVLEMARRHPGQVWEVTHTSGHRFAPTAVLLPAGTLHGRLDPAAAEDLLHAASRGETVLAGNRGRSTWAAPAQAAELAVREACGELSLSALTVAAHGQVGDRSWSTDVLHTDGRAWRVATRSLESDTQRAESCGKTLTSMRYHTHVVRRR